MKKASVGVCIKDGKVLLLRKSVNSSKWAGYFSFPGGHLEEDESFEDALVREYREETNRDIINYELIGYYAKEDTYINVYRVKDDGTPVIISDEHDLYVEMNVEKALDNLPLGNMTRKFLGMEKESNKGI
jgi:8-oxo-dGTP diphosphatase